MVYEVLAAPDVLVAAPFTTGGRAGTADGQSTDVIYGWPGEAFETAFRGNRLYFKIGAGKTTVRVIVDGHALPAMLNPSPGYYEVSDLGTARHRVRIEAATERHAEPAHFSGFYLMPEEKPLK